MQQARRAMRGASRRSREERQGRKAQVVWQTPAPRRTEAASSSTDGSERTQRAGPRKLGADAQGLCRWRGLTAPCRCARPGAVLWQPQERKLAAGAAGIRGSQPHRMSETRTPAAHQHPIGRPPNRCPRRRSEGQEGWFQGRPDDPGGRERDAPCRPAPPIGRTRSRRPRGEGQRSTTQSRAGL